MNDRATSQPVTTPSFFDRARARLTLEVPPALTDPTAEGARGDLDLNPDVWRARRRQSHQARGGARSGDRSRRTDGAVDAADGGACQPCRAGGLSGRQDRSRRRKSGRGGVARSQRGDRAAAGLDRADRLPRSLSDVFGLPHFADRGARQARTSRSTLNPREVTEAFEVPLAFLMTPANHQRKTRDWNGFDARLLRDPVSRTATFGASPLVSCGTFTSGFAPDDQANPHRDRAVSHSVRALCRVPVGDARRIVAADVLDAAAPRRAGDCRRSCS